MIIAIGISNVTGIQYLIPTNRQTYLSISVITGAGVNFVLNIFFIKYFASIGAAFSSVIAEFFISFLLLFLVRKELSLYKIFKSGLNYYIAGTVMMVILLFMRDKFEPSLMNTVFLVLIGGSIYLLILVILKDEFFVSNLKAILRKFKIICIF